MAIVGIIGGSGLSDLDISDKKEVTLETPFGSPSGNYITGTFEGTKVVFLSRHGKGHTINPSEVNYRANVYGMKLLGVEAIITVSPVGSLQEKIKPGSFVIPDQFFDRTKSRKDTFFTDIVVHVNFANPISKEISEILFWSSVGIVGVFSSGTYVNMEGPQFSTKAESELYHNWGMHIIGMTNLTEAKLCREAEISFASLCSVTDYDSWYPNHASVTVEMIQKYLAQNVINAKKILHKAIPEIGKLEKFSASNALQGAIMTDLLKVPEQTKKSLELFIGKYIPLSSEISVNVSTSAFQADCKS